MKVNQPKEGPPNLDDLSYRHSQQMLYNHTTQFQCINISNGLIYVEHLSVRNNVVDMLPTKNDRAIGDMVLEKNFKLK